MDRLRGVSHCRILLLLAGIFHLLFDRLLSQPLAIRLVVADRMSVIPAKERHPGG
jgi:hypothetical protein